MPKCTRLIGRSKCRPRGAGLTFRERSLPSSWRRWRRLLLIETLFGVALQPIEELLDVFHLGDLPDPGVIARHPHFPFLLLLVDEASVGRAVVPMHHYHRTDDSDWRHLDILSAVVNILHGVSARGLCQRLGKKIDGALPDHLAERVAGFLLHHLVTRMFHDAFEIDVTRSGFAISRIDGALQLENRV